MEQVQSLEYPVVTRGWYAVTAIVLAVLLAGFWNYHFVDGLGRDVIAGGTIGDPSTLAGTYAINGAAFGFLFAAIAGLAATFTACNCVVFAMLPGLVCASNHVHRAANPWMALAAFLLAVLLVSAAYGIYVGNLGADGIAAFNERSVRLAQAQVVFTGIGVVMLVWGFIELGFASGVTRRLPAGVVAALGTPMGKAAIIGLMVGLFSVGRPFPVFRDFLVYAVEAGSPLYAASVMMVQGLGQVAVMVALFALLVWLGGRRLMAWSMRNPHKPVLLSALALIAGGSFFVFYWGLAFAFDVGRWGFKLGWY